MRYTAFTSAWAVTFMLAGGAFAGGGTFVDDFEGGANIGGWRIGPFDTIEPSGGNPGGWLHSNTIDTFAPIAESSESASSPFVGDFRAMMVTNISFDAQTIARDFGTPTGFEMTLLLRDTKGTATLDDDDFAYQLGPEVPQVGEGWQGFSFDVPSDVTDPVPSGWKGGWVGDPEMFRPGVDWNDVITSVDRVEIWWINPAFLAILAQWDVGLDNISITTIPAPGALLLLSAGAMMRRRRRP